jgi:hypothetical protein
MSNPIVIAGFPITAEVSLKQWGEHMDIGYEIVNHGRRARDHDYGDEPKGTWNYYVSINEKVLDPAHFAEFWLEPAAESRLRSDGWNEPSYAYYSAPFADADWHGGVTLYEKKGGIDGAPRHVRIGCDFAHLWDEGRTYDFADVERKAKRTIDALRAIYPFKRRCVYTGIWLPEDQMIVGERGNLYSPEGKAKSDAWRAEREQQQPA